MSNPTRIIDPPYYKTVKGTKLRSHTSKCMFVRCDDGQEYAVKDLAEIIGIIYTSLKNRIKKWGWDNENVLSEASPMYSVHRRKRKEQTIFPNSAIETGSTISTRSRSELGKKPTYESREDRQQPERYYF